MSSTLTSTTPQGAANLSQSSVANRTAKIYFGWDDYGYSQLTFVGFDEEQANSIGTYSESQITWDEVQQLYYFLDTQIVVPFYGGRADYALAEYARFHGLQLNDALSYVNRAFRAESIPDLPIAGTPIELLINDQNREARETRRLKKVVSALKLEFLPRLIKQVLPRKRRKKPTTMEAIRNFLV